jgi:starch synthase
MNILFVASEVSGYAKSGGLADVASALPKAIKKLKHNIKVIMPRYYQIDKTKLDSIGSLSVPMGILGELWCEVFTTNMGEVEVYFIDYELYFGRANLYNDDNGVSYSDNDERFIFLSKASFELAKMLDFRVDIIHANDWHTALMPTLLKSKYRYDSHFENTATLLTIHNMQHQGKFDKRVIDIAEIGWESFTPDNLEEFGRVNFLKSGITQSDVINTVSPKYAKEIKTAQFGWGLEGYLGQRELLFGILNGVDYDEWSPQKDKYIAKNYSYKTLKNKQICKKDLQKTFNLPQKESVPIIGFVGRFATQKGIEIISQAIWELLEMDIQLIILGSGEKWAEGFFSDIAKRYPTKFATYIGYNNELAHKIEAGSDMFLMPSLFEPCGLNQIYSLAYGTLPIVRAVGGLDDTIRNFDKYTQKPNGFKFYEDNKDALIGTVRWAVDIYYNDKKSFKELIKNAMSDKFNWSISAKKYEKIYKLALYKRELSSK